MKLRPMLSYAAVAVTAVALSVAVLEHSAGAAPHSRPAAAAHPGPTAAPHSARASWLVQHGTHPAAAPGSATVAPAQPAPAVRGLAPDAAQQPAAPNGTVRVTVAGDAAAVAGQVRAAGGRVLVSSGGFSSVVVPKAKLAALASAPGVRSVRATQRPQLDSTTPPPNQPSQGVAASGADVWHNAGLTGAGVKVAVVDAEFGDSADQYNAEVAAGHLGTNPQLTNEDCTTTNHVSTPYLGPHGLEVAEIVSQEAPGTQLFLYCVQSPTGVQNAELDMEAKGITIATSSLSWFGDARGDGTGPDGSVAATVKRARQHHILWFESTGNYTYQHWSGSLVDRNRDHVLDMGNATPSSYPFQSDFFYAAPNSTELDLAFQWDQWQGTPSGVYLEAYGVQCTTDFGQGGLDNCNGFWLNGGQAVPGTPASGHPYAAVDTHLFPNTYQYTQIWQVRAILPSGFPAGAHYDLIGYGDTYYASDLACQTVDSTGQCIDIPAAAYQGSATSPSNSPYAVGVGAVDVGLDGVPQGTFEEFSSQGPTIDGRVKPDIAGWDGVSSYLDDYSTGFYGTSAATPHVAGAAALVAAANPDMDAAQLEDFLERRAGTSPPTNQEGHGPLTLGATTGVVPPAGSGYTPLPTPVRVLNTRDGTGGRHTPLGTGQTVTVSLPAAAGVPADATAIAVNLTGTNATGTTFLAIYPGGRSYPGTSNLNLAPTTDSVAAIFTVVTLGPGQTLTVRNAGKPTDSLVDVLGYFSASSTGKYSPLSPVRILDTRSGLGTGGVVGPVGSGQTLTVTPPASAGVPADATGLVVNVTAAHPAGSGFFTVSPDGSGSTSTLNYLHNDRANLAIVGLDSTGSFRLRGAGAAAAAIVDVEGYISPSGASTYVPLPSPVRIADTRTGNGGRKAILGAHTTMTVQGGGIFDVPYGAKALLTGTLAISATGGGFFSVYPDGTSRPSASSLNFTAGRLVPNGVVAGLSSASSGGAFDLYNALGTTHAVVDLFGYFI